MTHILCSVCSVCSFLSWCSWCFQSSWHREHILLFHQRKTQDNWVGMFYFCIKWNVLQFCSSLSPFTPCFIYLLIRLILHPLLPHLCSFNTLFLYLFALTLLSISIRLCQQGVTPPSHNWWAWDWFSVRFWNANLFLAWPAISFSFPPGCLLSLPLICHWSIYSSSGGPLRPQWSEWTSLLSIFLFFFFFFFF